MSVAERNVIAEWLDQLFLIPFNCLSTISLLRRPRTAVSVYSKSARVRKGAHGFPSVLGRRVGIGSACGSILTVPSRGIIVGSDTPL